MFSKARFYSFDRSKLLEEDVWNIPIERNMRTREAGHNAAFPTELARRAIEVGSPVGGHVLDPFVGSGTTIFAALAHDRNAVGIDMGADYVDYITTTLQADGHKPTTWYEVQKKLIKPSAAWKSWAGNKANFRKPGRGKTSAE